MNPQDLMSKIAAAIARGPQYNEEVEVTDPGVAALLLEAHKLRTTYVNMVEQVQEEYNNRLKQDREEAEKDLKFAELLAESKVIAEEANALGEHIDTLVKHHEGLEQKYESKREEMHKRLSELFPDGGKFREQTEEKIEALNVRFDMDVAPLHKRVQELLPELAEPTTQVRIDEDRVFYRTRAGVGIEELEGVELHRPKMN